MQKIELSRRLRRESKTILGMLKIYCRKKHGGKKLCEECNDIFQFSLQRLAKCPFADEKPSCQNCKIHCYRKPYREKVQEVMRFAGPLMIFRHPDLALCHLYDVYFRGERGLENLGKDPNQKGPIPLRR